MSEVKFVDGLFVNAPHEKAPDFVKMSMSIRPDEFAGWLKQQEPNDKGYVRLQVKEGKSGKWYASLDDYKPKEKTEPANNGFVDDDIPDFGGKDEDIPFAQHERGTAA